MTDTLILPAPGKLNLFLHVLGRRDDGYHRLQTVFQLVDLCDELVFELRDTGEVELGGDLAGVEPERNLVLRASRLLATRTGSGDKGARITVTKRLPIGGGMGGGSSDAATTLIALNRLWDCGLDQAQLESLGLEIGADVPLFVRGETSWAEGVGEELQPIEVPSRWYLVVEPQSPASTAEVFASTRLTRDTRPITIADFLAGAAVRNDCEAVVRRISEGVDEALRWLSQGGPARMTGTGSCVFLPFDDRAGAEQICARVPDRWRGFVTRGLSRSPLHE